MNFNKINFKLFYLLLIPLVLFILFYPSFAHALIGGIFEWFNTSLSGLSEMTLPIMTFLIKIFFLYFFGLAFLYSSVFFLELTMNPNWLQIQGNPLVEYGWQFSANIANMALILFLVFIAFTIILKIDTFKSKKSLTRLIIIAFVLNFSLVFIGALVDVSNILYNTFFEGNADLPSRVIESLGVSGGSILSDIMVWLTILASKYLVPFLSPFAQFAVIIAMLGIYAPTFINWGFQITCFFLVGGIFFMYSILFIARVFIVQLLAILSPLALIAYIFPSTQKYTKMWFHYLITWLTLGILLFFFMALGLAATDALTPSNFGTFQSVILIPGASWFQLGEYVVYYTFLTLYLAIAFGLSLKLAPAGAKQIVGMATAAGGVALGAAVVPAGKILRKKSSSFAAEQEKKRENLEKEIKRTGKSPKITKVDKIKMGTGKLLEQAHKVSGTTAAIKVDQDIAEEEKILEKRFGTGVGGAIKAKEFFDKKTMENPSISREKKASIALYLAKNGGEKGLSGLTDSQLKDTTETIAKIAPHELKNIVKHKPGLTKESSIVANAMVPDGENDKDVKHIMEEDGINLKEAKIKAAQKKAIEGIKEKDIETFSDKTLENNEFQEILVRFAPPKITLKICEEKGADYSTQIDAKIKDVGIEKIAAENPNLLRLRTTPLGRAVFSEIPGVSSRDEVEKIINKARERKTKEDRERTFEKSQKKEGGDGKSIGEIKGFEKPKSWGKDKCKLKKEKEEKKNKTFKTPLGGRNKAVKESESEEWSEEEQDKFDRP
jgi:hypothetical protein